MQAKEASERLELIAPDSQGCFPVEHGEYIKLDEAQDALSFRLSPPDADGKYSEDQYEVEKIGKNIGYYLQMIEEDLMGAIGGNDNKHQENGRLILAYMLSYLFFDEIYEVFKQPSFY